MVDTEAGHFLCQECYLNFEADPNAPPKETYTLQLVDNSSNLKEAVDNLRRLTVQMSGKTIGNHQLRVGIYDLLQKVRGKGKSPITSNLPSENFALGIGSKRLAGTGRTAGIKARKLEQAGDSAAAKKYLVGGGNRSAEGSDLTFLKNAMGNEIAFTVEKGGGARANLLATKRRRRLKLLDAAASRVGASLPLHIAVREKRKREEEKAEQEALASGKKRPKKDGPGGLEFLQDNIGRGGIDTEKHKSMTAALKADEEEDDESIDEEQHALVLAHESEDFLLLSDEDRKTAFQSQYKKEMNRQMDILKFHDMDPSGNIASPPNLRSSFTSTIVTDVEEEDVEWEDG